MFLTCDFADDSFNHFLLLGCFRPFVCSCRPQTMVLDEGVPPAKNYKSHNMSLWFGSCMRMTPAIYISQLPLVSKGLQTTHTNEKVRVFWNQCCADLKLALGRVSQHPKWFVDRLTHWLIVGHSGRSSCQEWLGRRLCSTGTWNLVVCTQRSRILQNRNCLLCVPGQRAKKNGKTKLRCCEPPPEKTPRPFQ